MKVKLLEETCALKGAHLPVRSSANLTGNEEESCTLDARLYTNKLRSLPAHVQLFHSFKSELFLFSPEGGDATEKVVTVWGHRAVSQLWVKQLSMHANICWFVVSPRASWDSWCANLLLITSTQRAVEFRKHIFKLALSCALSHHIRRDRSVKCERFHLKFEDAAYRGWILHKMFMIIAFKNFPKHSKISV